MMSYHQISWSLETAILDDLVKSRNSDIGCCTDRITLKFDRHFANAADAPVKYQSDWKILNWNLTA